MLQSGSLGRYHIITRPSFLLLMNLPLGHPVAFFAQVLPMFLSFVGMLHCGLGIATLCGDYYGRLLVTLIGARVGGFFGDFLHPTLIPGQFATTMRCSFALMLASAKDVLGMRQPH